MSWKRLVAFAALTVSTAGAAAAETGTAVSRLRAFEEVPALSSPGAGGRFEATMDSETGELDWQLSYWGTKGNVTQAHLHFAQRGVNGGIVLFLCSNLGNGPVGTPACPAAGTPDAPAVVSGSTDGSDVGSGANGQGVAPGEIHEVLRGIRAGVVYANVHTDLFPAGEVRGQLLYTPDEGEAVAEEP